MSDIDYTQFEGHTPGPWKYEPGGGHAPNRIVGSTSTQKHGSAERINGKSNASWSNTICENMGSQKLPAPRANVALIAAAPELLAEHKAQAQRIAELESRCAELAEALRPFLGQFCTCDEAYKARKMRDPNCRYCDWESEIENARAILWGRLYLRGEEEER